METEDFMSETQFKEKSSSKRGLGWFIWGGLNIVLAIMVKSINPAIFAALLIFIGWYRRKH